MKRFLRPRFKNQELLPCYTYSVGGRVNQSPIDRPDGYSYYIWLYTKQGEGKLFLGEEEYVLNSNNGVLIYPGVIHRYYTIKKPWTTHWVSFQGFAVKSLLQLMGFNQSAVFELTNVQMLERNIQEIFTCTMSDVPDLDLKSSGKLYNFLVELPQCVRNEKNEYRANRLEPLLLYLEEHYGNRDLTLESMADIIKVSPQYLCRLFKEDVFLSPIVYLTRLRLHKAKELLIERSLNVSQISHLVGFSDSSYFCSVFKQYEGMTPMQFRKRYR